MRTSPARARHRQGGRKLSASDGTGKGVLIAGRIHQPGTNRLVASPSDLPCCGPKPAPNLQPAQPRVTSAQHVLRLALAKAAAAVKETSPDWEAEHDR
jgi:hypothetical protein